MFSLLYRYTDVDEIWYIHDYEEKGMKDFIFQQNQLLRG